MKRFFTVFMTLVVLLNSFPHFIKVAVASVQSDCESVYQSKGYPKPPPGTPSCNVKGQMFNYSLWKELGITVYLPSSIDPRYLPDNSIFKELIPGNSYKAGWQEPNDPFTEHPNPFNLTPAPDRSPDGKRPYFNNKQGEWRYYGYSYGGTAFNNPYFIDDKKGPDPDERKWIFRPWENTGGILNGRSDRPKSVSPILSKWSGDLDKIPSFDKVVINSIIRTNDVSIKYSTNPVDLDKYFYNYMYVDQNPTAWAPGSGTMWSVGQHNKVWNQSFLIPKLLKELLPVKANIDVVGGNVINLDNYKDEVMPIKVKVTGELLDYGKWNDEYEGAKYYHRKDISSWKLSLEGQSSTSYTPLGNTGYYTFTLNLQKSKFKPGDKLDLHAVTTSIFAKDPSKRSTGNIVETLTFTGSKTGAVKSFFEVNNNISFKDLSYFTPGSVMYDDQSTPPNNISKYVMMLENDQGQVSTIKTYTIPSGGKLNESTVNQDLYSYMKSFFSSSDTDKTVNFKFTQTIESVSTPTSTSSYVQNVKVTKFTDPPPDCSEGCLVELPHIECNCAIPDNAYDIVPFEPSDGTDMSQISDRNVYVDGKAVDDNLFFGGGYIFGDDQDGFHQVIVEHYDLDGNLACRISEWVYVWDTKPRAQFDLTGPYKQNRKMIVDDKSNDPGANHPFVLNRFPITDYKWEYVFSNGDISPLKIKADGDKHKEFLYKKEGIYGIKLTVTNSLGRKSEPVIVTFEVLPDLDPAVILHPYNSQVPRGQKITLFDDAVSTDGDIIKTHTIKVYYDSKNDESYDQLVDTFNGPISEYVPSTNKLGHYKIIATVDEDFGEDTIPEFITSADRRSKTMAVTIEVDNYAPYSDIYTDIPNIRPQVDVFFMLDKNLDLSKIDYVKGNEVAINNQLRQEGMLPDVKSWNMHTYTYDTPGQTTYNSGRSYPPSTYIYSSGEYSGTLSLSSASDNGSWHDYGYTAYQTDSQYFTRSMSNTVTASGWTNPQETTYKSNDQLSPSCYSINENGYSGCIGNKTVSSGSPTYNYGTPVCTGTGKNKKCRTPWSSSQTFTASYSGTLTKQSSYWVPNVQWDANWTGMYKGTLYKDVREPYVNPFSRTSSTKYIVYFSNDIINEIWDFDRVKKQSDARVILIGNNNIKTQSGYDYFIPNTGQSAQAVIDSVVSYIAQNNPEIPATYTLINQPFKLFTNETDAEDDPMSSPETMYIHDANYFDNSHGKASFAVAAYDSNDWKPQNLQTMFDKPGKYTVIRRLKDKPSSDPNFAEYGYYSNESRVTIIAHRKPIALAQMEFDYQTATNDYNTTWTDHSYDLDHNIRDRLTRGIIDRKIRYSKDGGEWVYKIPDTLDPGSYRLEYIVMDKENTWSDPFVMTFTLASAPPVQLDAKVRTELSRFTLTSVPASEDLRMYDIWTRYPYSVYLDIALFQGGVKKTTSRIIPYYTGTKDDNDISWNDVIYNIPSTLPDGSYTFRITGVGQNNITAYKDFSTAVLTPINLVPIFPSEMIVGDSASIAATTSKYANNLQVTLFKGTLYQSTITMPAGTLNGFSKDWSKSIITPNIPDGTYLVEYRATTANGNVETKMVQTKVVHNRPPAAAFDWSPKPVWEGDKVNFVNKSSDPDGDSLTSLWEITRPDGTKLSSASDNPGFPFMLIGNYTVKLTVSDGNASNSVTKNIWATELTIQPTVEHTADWFLHHQKNKHEVTDAPKDFYSGELFIVKTVTSDTPVDKVSAWIDTTGIDGKNIKVSVSLSTDGAAARYKGELFDERFLSMKQGLPKGIQQIHFEVQYSNGVVKRDTVPVNIIGNVNQAVGVHRRH